MVSALHEFMTRLNGKETQVVFDFLDAVNQGIENTITKAKNTT
jgi:hypothetical protein